MPVTTSRRLLAGVLLLALTGAVWAQEAEPPRALLRQKVTDAITRIASEHDGVIGVAIRDLTAGEDILLNERLVFPTGSSIKIPVLIELHRQAAAGALALADQRSIARGDRVGGSGVLTHFGDRSRLSLEDLAVLMVVLSDNTATNMLIDHVGMDNVNHLLDGLGLGQIRLRRKMINQAASARGDENVATPLEAMRLMEQLYKGEAVSRSVSDAVLATLTLHKTSPIPRLLPSDVAIANKPGGIEGASCDWAIVYVPNRPYAIAVMSTFNGEGADAAIAQISKVAYDYFARLSRSTAFGARVPLDLLRKPQ